MPSALSLYGQRANERKTALIWLRMKMGDFMRYHGVLLDAIMTFGERAQMVVALEELAELQKEITKQLRGEGNLDHLSEEMADVQIMLDQLEIMFANRGDVATWQNVKAARLAQRIAEYKANE